MALEQLPAPLPQRPLGTTGLLVPSLCIGCAALGDMPESFAYSVSEAEALATYHAILDGPITFLDTAASYGDGESERRLGTVLAERGGVPPGVVIATKADRDMQTGDFSGGQIRRSVERSLRLLGLDRLPLCYLHDPEHISYETAMAPGGPIEALRRCHEEGLVEHIGIAGGPIEMMIRYVETDLFEAAISHNRYTLLNTSADPFLDACRQHGVAALNAAPYGSGILAKGPRSYARYAYQDVAGEIVDRTLQLEEICGHYQVPLAAAALQFSIRDPRIASTIVGVTKPERLRQTVDLAGYPIPDALWAALATVSRTTDDPEANRWNS